MTFCLRKCPRINGAATPVGGIGHERLFKWPRLVGSGVEILRAMSGNAAETRTRFGRDG